MSTTEGKTRARITATERRRHRDAEAAQLRAQGLSYDDVAERLGFRDRGGAHKAVARALAGTVQHSTDTARRLAQQRLDGLRQALIAVATDTSVAPRDVVSALRALLAVEEREARLLGLDLAAAPGNPVTSTVLDAEIERLTRELTALDAPRSPDPWAEWTPPPRTPPRNAPADEHQDDRRRAEVVPLTHRKGGRR